MRTFVLSKAVMHRTIRARDDSALALHAALGAGKRQQPGGAAPDRKGEACRPARLSPRSPAVATAALAADGAPSSRAPRSLAAWWGSLTQRLVGLSTLPFLLLFAPQLALNARSLHAGAPEALAILSYMVRSSRPPPPRRRGRCLAPGVGRAGRPCGLRSMHRPRLCPRPAALANPYC